MRLFFPNLSRPKKAAKRIARSLPGHSLSAIHRGIAIACGFQDWHDLEQRCTSDIPSKLDDELSSNDYIERQVELALSLGRALDVPDGDAQYALASARLCGDKRISLSDQIAIRIACWRSSILSKRQPRNPGAVGRLKVRGRHSSLAILRRYGRPTETITDGAVTLVGDFEYVSPRVAPELFLPMRLFLPYGHWKEPDGSLVVFSRDYFPMWRINAGEPPKRLSPWTWIQVREETHYWDDANTPWHSNTLKAELEARLSRLSVFSLPVLADALPLLILNPTEKHFQMDASAELLKEHRTANFTLIA